MPFVINHIHLKSNDPQRSAAWWSEAFNFTIVSDQERGEGVRFVTCRSENGIQVNISSAPAGETLPPGNSGIHEGLEHFGFDSANLEADIARLEALGAKLVDGPHATGTARICFLAAPDEVRIELVERASPATG